MKKDEDFKRKIIRMLTSQTRGYYYFAENFNNIELLGLKENYGDYDIKYDFPFSKDNLEICCRDGELDIYFNYDNKTIHIGSENTGKEKFTKGELLNKIMKERRLDFAPRVPKEFVNEITKIKPGQILDISNNMSLLCTQRDNEQIVLKEQYNGSLEKLSLDDFLRDEEYVIHRDNLKDIQYLFSRGYSYAIGNMELRIRIPDNSGFDVVNKAEQMTPDGTSLFHIGSIQLRVLNDNDKHIWYDSDGAALDRDKVATLFGWAKNSALSFETHKMFSADAFINRPITDHDEVYYAKIQECTLKRDFEGLVRHAFDYSCQNDDYASMFISGLKTAENGIDMDARSYAFVDTDGQQRIYEIRYEDNDFSKSVTEAKEISREEFVRFCEEKYREPFILIREDGKTQYKSRAEQAQLLQRYLKEGTNPLGLSPKELNTIRTNIKTLLKSYEDERSR